ncbi:MAG: hypothetical protein Q4C96_03130 [Planctomycetia bacterium]|nr:hypothetical protein [Planctomycetia bacterium]
MENDIPIKKTRPKPIVPEKLVIPERDPNEKPQNWLRAQDTKSRSARQKAERKRKLFKIYLTILFTVLAFVSLFIVCIFFFVYVRPITHDILTPQGKITKCLEGHEGIINSLAFSPDGKYILSGYNEKMAILWDVEKEIILRQMRGHRLPITSVALGMISTQNLSLRESEFSPEQELAILADAIIPPNSDEGQHPLKKYLVVTCSEDMYAFRWDIETVPPVPEIRFGDKVQRKVDPSLNSGMEMLPAEETISIFDLEEMVPAEGHKKIVRSVAVSANGAYVLTGSDDESAILWNPSNGTQYTRVMLHKGSVTAVALDPTNVSFATGGMDRIVMLSNLNTDKLIYRLEGHNGPVLSLCYSSDGKKLISGSLDNSVIIWDTEKGTILRQIDTQTAVKNVAISSSGKYVLTNMTQDSAVLWEVETGKKVAQFIANAPILALTMSPEEDAQGRPAYIAAGTSEHQILLFTLPENI